MEENKKILEEWNASIECFPKLNFDTARKLYEDVSKENDRFKKKEKCNYLINGTLHVVASFISSNGLCYLESSVYDMNDIISTCNEIWISMINDGKLLKVNKFSLMFDYNFYIVFTSKLINDKPDIKYNNLFTVEGFPIFLYKYIQTFKNEDVSYEKFLDFLRENYLDFQNLVYYKCIDQFAQTYELFESIKELLDVDYKSDDFSKRKLINLKYLLMNSGLEFNRASIDNVYVNDESFDKLIDVQFYNGLFDILFSDGLLNDREKEIIKRRFGLFGYDQCCYKDIALEERVTLERIRQIESKIYTKVRRSIKLAKYVKEWGD